MSYSEIMYPLGTNTQVLAVNNAVPRGVGWSAGGGGGGINAVVGGDNIDVITVGAVATVSFLNPFNQTTNLGSEAILGVLGGQSLNIDYNDITLTDVPNDSLTQMVGEGIAVYQNSVPTTNSTLQYNNFTIQTATESIVIANNDINHNNGANTLTIQNSVVGQNLALNTNAGIITTNTSLQPFNIRDSINSTGALNQVLTAGAGGTLLWGAGGGGGTITSVLGGSNIDVATVGTVATVSLKAPLTTNLDMGAVDITTSTANGQIETVLNGTGAFVVSQSSAGGATNPATTFQNTNGNANAVHLDLYKNSATPANNDGIGALSYNANNNAGAKIEYARIAINQRDVVAGSENGSISLLTCLNNPTPTEFFRCDGSTGFNQLYRSLETNGLIIQNSLSVAGLNLRNTFGGSTTTISTTANANPIVMGTGNTNSAITITTTSTTSPINIQTTAGALSPINITANGGGDVNLSSNAGAIRMTGSSGGVVITQPLASSTKLTTSLANINYYPDFVVDNGNANTASVPLPSIPSQRLTVVNKGITPASSWVAFGANVMTNPENIKAQYFDPVYNHIWIGGDSGNIYIYDITLTTQISNAKVSGSCSGGATEITSICGDNQFVYVGGNFSTVNTNATGQYGITRFLLNPTVSPATEDVIRDPTNVEGVGGGYVLALGTVAGVLCVGGTFNSLQPSGSAVSFFFQIVNCQGATNTQSYQISSGGNSTDLNGYVNDITALSTSEIYVGGSFAYSVAPVATLNFFTKYDSTNCSFTALGGTPINGAVWANKLSVINSNYILVGGFFSAPYSGGLIYYDRATDTFIDTTCPGGVGGVYVIQCQGSKDIICDYNNNKVWSSSTLLTWTDLGAPLAVPSNYITTILNVNGYIQVSMDGNEQNYKELVSGQDCIFTLPSVGFTYTTDTKYLNYQLTSRNTCQRFIADSTGTYWILMGYNGIGNLS